MVTLFCVIVEAKGDAFSVDIDVNKSVDQLKKALKSKKTDIMVLWPQLQLFLAKKDGAWLKRPIHALSSENISSYKEMRGSWQLNNPDLFGPGFFFGENVIHVLVVIPPQVQYQAEVHRLRTAIIPALTPLDNCGQYLDECSLDQWKAGEVLEIPLISKFMKPLGGCTKKKKILWREEEKQVASILLDRWFRESSGDSTNIYAEMRCVLMGSPGIGKSTLLIVIAFYLLLKRRKNVLVYRKLTVANQENCLLCLGYQDGKIVFFTRERCDTKLAENIYEELSNRSNVWLLLDGFDYERIPAGLCSYRMLATSQPVCVDSVS